MFVIGPHVVILDVCGVWMFICNVVRWESVMISGAGTHKRISSVYYAYETK